MKASIPSSASSRGVAAVELALWLPFLVLLLGAGLFLARFFWHYTVAQKAAHDAARFLAAATVTEMRVPPVGGGADNPVAAIARKIANDEIAELRPGGLYSPQINVVCDVFYPCAGQFVPKKVSVSIEMSVTDIFFPNLTYGLFNTDSLLIQTAVTTNYVGD
ncbi:pilus assembly protein [Massilia solisilvae]|uniref:Pilus assembly protein n=1 Tax=Massilia solisilvae TaxID=1811225 RepID=A0ABT2BQ43_9BURK|nr:TadE/TadG family type IV pilus assembly protein [Massilia solisilvae]MCS0609978.1 pilus assembly protein [Massilia solisilvae]